MSSIMRETDSESLISSSGEEQTQGARSQNWKRPAVALGTTVLALCVLASLSPGKVVKATPKAAIGFFNVPDGCFSFGLYYGHPHRQPDTDRTVENSAEDCQIRCKGTADCAHFTYWPDGGCLLTPETSVLVEAGVGHSDVVTGPKECKQPEAEVTTTVNEAIAVVAAVNAPAEAAGLNGSSCSAYPACVLAGLKEGTCCPAASGTSLACCNGIPPATPAAAPATVVVDNGPESPASCKKAPQCAALNLEGNCCPNDAGNSLGCCPGGGTAAKKEDPALANVAADSIQRCENNAACKENQLEGLCCPNPGGVNLGCCDSVMNQQLGAMGPLPDLKPPAAEPGPLMTFYMYRVDNDQKYALNGVNMASLDGDVWYLHNEVVASCPRKFGITRLTRFKVSYRATKQLYGQGKKFDNFVAFDKAKCTVPFCNQLHWEPYGFVVGCSPNDKGRVAVPGQPVWYSLPGTCPSKFYFQKTEECIKAEPGGKCKGKDVTGERDCTYTIEEAGEIKLDELSGIKDYNTVCVTTGQLEYDETADKGKGTSFWDGKADATKGAQRVKHIESLFAKRFPQWPAHLDDPPCEP